MSFSFVEDERMKVCGTFLLKLYAVMFVCFIHLSQEREKLKEEKKKYAERLKLWNKPREDMECDDLKVGSAFVLK